MVQLESIRTCTAGWSEQGVFHTLAVKAGLINVGVTIEGWQGQSLDWICWNCKLVRLNSTDIFIRVSLMLWNLSEMPLREERGSFDRMFKGSERRKPQQCQVYAHSSACPVNQPLCCIARIIGCERETGALGSATYKNHKLGKVI